MKCEVCHRGPPNGPSIYRVNPVGELPAIWRCPEHLTEQQRTTLEPWFTSLIRVLEKDKPKTP